MIRFSLLALAACSVLSFACGDDGDGGDGGVDCDQSTLTYANFAEPFISDYCLECHSANVTGADRKSAPVAVNFDTQSEVETQAGRIKARVSTGGMPTALSAAMPSQAERDSLVEWVDCGLK